MYRIKLVLVIFVAAAAVIFFVSRENVFLSRAVSAFDAPSNARGPGPVPAPSPSTGGCLQPPVVSSQIPADMANVSQQDANCFAWQEFISLNWPADTATCAASPAPASQFGQPGNTDPVVWETYKEANEVFLAGAAKPKGWCAQQSVPMNLTKAKVSKLKPTSRHGIKFLISNSKADANPNVTLADFQQAEDHSWLTAQKNNNQANYIALFEVRINSDEFNYIDQNALYDAAVQQTFAQNPGINLPDGTPQFSRYGSTGTIELKAAWIQLDDPAQWSNFKTSQAYVVYPWDPKNTKLVTVGLVGLHIIHKTGSGKQFIWATFEHVNNAPSTADISNNTLLPWYTFYNAQCNSVTDFYKCSQNAGAAPEGYPACATDPGKNPDKLPICSQTLYQSPVQVVRTTPISNISTNNINGLNQYVWGKISAANPNSVFRNYQLVNVLWSNSSTTIQAGAKTPLTQGDPQPPPGVQPVANTTLETYLQANTCSSCHIYAPIASVGSSKKAVPVDLLRQMRTGKAEAGSPGFASDYSFLLSRAQTAPGKPKPNGKK